MDGAHPVPLHLAFLDLSERAARSDLHASKEDRKILHEDCHLHLDSLLQVPTHQESKQMCEMATEMFVHRDRRLLSYVPTAAQAILHVKAMKDHMRLATRLEVDILGYLSVKLYQIVTSVPQEGNTNQEQMQDHLTKTEDTTKEMLDPRENPVLNVTVVEKENHVMKESMAGLVIETTADLASEIMLAV